jgi:hypothetical protein
MIRRASEAAKFLIFLGVIFPVPVFTSLTQSAKQTTQPGIVAWNTAAKAKTKTDGANYDWNWDIFLISDEETLRNIDHTEYILHPTFDDPIKTVKNVLGGPVLSQEKPFVFRAQGWGTFTVKVNVYSKNGAVTRLQYPLRFNGIVYGHVSKDITRQSELSVAVTAGMQDDGAFTFVFDVRPIKEGQIGVRLRGIDVRRDGSLSSTKWAFRVLANGKQLLDLGVRQYSKVGNTIEPPLSPLDRSEQSIYGSAPLDLRILGQRP